MSLPKATTVHRADSYDLYKFYRDESRKEEPKPHPLEGQRVAISQVNMVTIVRNGKEGFLLTAGGGSPLTRRPEIVYELRRGVDTSPAKDHLYTWIEGVVRGPVKFDKIEWDVNWTNLTPQESTPDHFLLIDDAVIIAKPKE